MIKYFLSAIRNQRWMYLGLLASVGFAAGYVQPVAAQFGSSTPQPLEDLQNPNRGGISFPIGGGIKLAVCWILFIGLFKDRGAALKSTVRNSEKIWILPLKNF